MDQTTNPHFLQPHNPHPQTVKEFKMLINRLNAELKRDKIVNCEELFSNIGAQSSHVVWIRVNRISGRKNKSNTPGKIIHNGNLLTGIALANQFNLHFVSNNNPNQNLPPQEMLCPGPAGSLFIDLTSITEICSTFTCVKYSKPLDVNTLQIAPIKHVIEYIAAPLSHNFNFILERGEYPTAMKKS